MEKNSGFFPKEAHGCPYMEKNSGFFPLPQNSLKLKVSFIWHFQKYENPFLPRISTPERKLMDAHTWMPIHILYGPQMGFVWAQAGSLGLPQPSQGQGRPPCQKMKIVGLPVQAWECPQTAGQTDRWTLPSTLSPCFSKATRSIKIYFSKKSYILHYVT